MTTIIEHNNSKNFPNPSEGKINSKGMISPPVFPKPHRAKIAVAQSKSLQGILHETDTQAKTNGSSDKQFKYEVKLPGVIHTTVRKNHVGSGLKELNLKKEANSAASEPNVTKKKKVTFANPEYHIIQDNVTEHQPTLSEYMMKKEKEAQESNPFKTLRETMPMYENVNALDDAFEEDNHQKSSDLHQAQATNDSTPCLEPQRSEVSSAAGDELETTKFLKTLSKEERKNIDFSPKQQNNQKVETSKKTYNPLDWNPIYQGKKRVSLDRFKIHPLLCSDIDGYVAPDKRNPNLERCKVTHDDRKIAPKIGRKHGFQSDPSIKHIKVDTAVCSITKCNDKKDIRPDVSHKQKPSSEVSGAKVRELIRQIEQGSRSC